MRVWNDKKRVSTLRTTQITMTPESDDPFQEIAINEEDDTAENNTVRIPCFHSIEAVNSYLYCVNCSKRILQPSSDRLIKCDNKKCNYIMRSADCPKKLFVTVIVKQADNTDLHLCITQELLANAIKADIESLPELQIADALLDFKNIEITYNAERVVSNITSFDP